MNNGMTDLTLHAASWNARSLRISLDGVVYVFAVGKKTPVPSDLADELLTTQRGKAVASRVDGDKIWACRYDKWEERKPSTMTVAQQEKELAEVRANVLQMQETLNKLLGPKGDNLLSGDVAAVDEVVPVEDGDVPRVVTSSGFDATVDGELFCPLCAYKTRKPGEGYNIERDMKQHLSQKHGGNKTPGEEEDTL
jgi:hypothetical protein